jgi:hypothetical protein
MKTTIDMAREAGFMLRAESVEGQSDWWECFDEEIERLVALVRADEREQARSAPVQEPVAMLFGSLPVYDTTPPAAPVQEPVARLKGVDEYGPMLDWYTHWTDFPVGTKFYTSLSAQSPPVQEPVSMRMPKVGDKVVCIEDESLGTVVYLTAGGSPEIKFDDGSHGTYMLREFAELFGYTTPPAAEWQKIECPICGDMAIATDIPAAQRKPLTDEQIEREWQFLHDEEGNPPDHHDFARAIEAAHNIKENT